MRKISPSHWPITLLSSVSSVLNIAMALILVRVLTPEDLGVFKIFFLYVTLCPCFCLASGLNNSLYYWGGRGKSARSELFSAGWMTLIMAVVGALFCLIFQREIAQTLHWPLSYISPFVLSIFAIIAAGFYEDALVATGRIWRGALFGAIFESIRILTLIAVAWFSHRVYGVLVAHATVQVLRVLCGYGLALRQGLLKSVLNLRAWKTVLRYILPVSVSGALVVGMDYSDQILLSRWLTPLAFAYYSVGCLTLPPLNILQASVTRVLIAQLSRCFQGGQTEKASELHRKAQCEISYLVIPSVVGLIVFAKPILVLLFTERYLSSVIYLRYFALSYLLLIIGVDTVPRAKGQVIWVMKFFSGSAFFTVLVCWALTVSFGALGALLGLLASRTLTRIYSLYHIRKITDWDWKEIFPIRFHLRITGISLALGLLCLLTKNLFKGELSWFLVMGSLFTAVYFLSTWGISRFLFFKRGPLQALPSRKVLMLTQHMGIGGLEKMILNLSVYLNQEGEWKPRVFVYDHLVDSAGELVSPLRAAGVEVNVFQKPKGFSWKVVLKIISLALRERVEVVHSHDLGALIYAILAKVFALGSFKVVHTQHSFVHLGRKRRYRFYERFFVRLADRISVVSENVRDTYLELGVNPQRVQVITNGVPLPGPISSDYGKSERRSRFLRGHFLDKLKDDEFSPSLSVLAESFWILYLGRIFPRKGQDHAISLWRELPGEMRARSALIFVGPPTDQRMNQRLGDLIEAAPDRGRIFRMGPTLEPESWIELSDVFLSCSEFEGMPLGPIEAMNRGLPAVLSRIPGHDCLKEFSETYNLSRPKEGAAVMEGIYQRILARELQWRAKLIATQQGVRAQFSVEKMAGKYKELYA